MKNRRKTTLFSIRMIYLGLALVVIFIAVVLGLLLDYASGESIFAEFPEKYFLIANILGVLGLTLIAAGIISLVYQAIILKNNNLSLVCCCVLSDYWR